MLAKARTDSRLLDFSASRSDGVRTNCTSSLYDGKGSSSLKFIVVCTVVCTVVCIVDGDGKCTGDISMGGFGCVGVGVDVGVGVGVVEAGCDELIGEEGGIEGIEYIADAEAWLGRDHEFVVVCTLTRLATTMSNNCSICRSVELYMRNVEFPSPPSPPPSLSCPSPGLRGESSWELPSGGL